MIRFIIAKQLRTSNINFNQITNVILLHVQDLSFLTLYTSYVGVVVNLVVPPPVSDISNINNIV